MIYVIDNFHTDVEGVELLEHTFRFVEIATPGEGRVLEAAITFLNARGYWVPQRTVMRADVVVSNEFRDEFRDEFLGVFDFIKTFTLSPLRGHEEAYRAALLRLHVTMRLEGWDIPDWLPTPENGGS